MRRTGIALSAAALAFTMATTLAGGALAQEPALQPPPPPTPAPAATGDFGAQAQGGVAVGGNAQAQGQAQGTGAMTLPPPPPPQGAPPPPPPPARVAPGNSDHDQMVGTLAIGYLGARNMVVGCNTGGGGTTGTTEGTQPGTACTGRQQINAPVIGVRYWITDLIGIDAGLGMAINSLSANNGVDRPTTTAFLIHGGVPLALASTGHFSFQIIPEMNIGFSHWAFNDASGDGSGFHFDIGARAGAEIHFGFIGIPQLSLLGTIGLAFAMDSSKASPPGAPSQSNTEIAFGTSVQNSPWGIFRDNVSALYYF